MQGHLDIGNPDSYVAGVPHREFARLRREAPVSWHSEASGPGYWALTKHADIVSVSRDPATFTQAPSLFIEDLPPGNLRDHPDVMINMDPPRHTRFRALVSKGFSPRSIQRLEGRVREVVSELCDAFAGRGSIDFVSAFASELPLRIILELVGVPPRAASTSALCSAKAAGWARTKRARRLSTTKPATVAKPRAAITSALASSVGPACAGTLHARRAYMPAAAPWASRRPARRRGRPPPRSLRGVLPVES